jgi:hypothetical protein
VLLDALADVRWLALLAASVAAFVLGAVWFAPSVLGTLWARDVAGYTGSTTEDVARRAAQPSALAPWFLSVLVATFVVELLLQASDADGLAEGASLGAILGVGVGAAFFSWPVVFARLPLRWWLLNSGAFVLMLAVAGAVLGAWS